MGTSGICPVAAPFNGWNAKKARELCERHSLTVEKVGKPKPHLLAAAYRRKANRPEFSINWKSKHNYLYRSL